MGVLRHKDLSFRLRGLIYKVRNELGVGWNEETYHQALVQVLQENTIPVISKQRHSLYHRGVEVHVFEPDLIIWNTLIAELKALPFDKEFAGAHYAQLIHYLKFFGKDLGFLVNFASSPLQIERVLWDEPELQVIEDYRAILPFCSRTDKECLQQICYHILALGKEYGLGYPETVYRKLIAIELETSAFSCELETSVTAMRHGTILSRHSTQHLLVANRYLVHIRALLGAPTSYDFGCTRTYLKNLGLPFGLVVNFGREQLQIYGVKAK